MAQGSRQVQTQAQQQIQTLSNFWKIRHWKRARRILPAMNTPTHPMRKPAQKMVETLAMIL